MGMYISTRQTQATLLSLSLSLSLENSVTSSSLPLGFFSSLCARNLPQRPPTLATVRICYHNSITLLQLLCSSSCSCLRATVDQVQTSYPSKISSPAARIQDKRVPFEEFCKLLSVG